MRLALEADRDILTVRSHAGGVVVVGEQQHTAPFAISAARLVPGLAVASAADLDLAALASAIEPAPRVLLIGVPEGAPRPPPALRRALEARGIASECMELGAACRTYNVLALERREVVAVLFP